MNIDKAPRTSFDAVDGNTNRSEFIAYLEKISALSPIKDYKKKVKKLLGIHSGDLMLDVGCGIGLDVRELVNRTDNVRFIGIDSSATMLDQARQLTSKSLLQSGAVNYVQGDINHLPLADNVSTEVRADRIFQHLHDAKQAFKEIARVTKPGGKIVIADSYWNSLKIDGIPNEDSEIVKKAYLGFIKNPSIAANLKDLFLAEGFTEKDISQEIMKLEFHGLQELELVLWIKPSLELGEKVGVITADEGLHVLQEIQATQESKIKTSFDLYIIKGIKP